MSNFNKTIASNKIILTEGGMVERIRREYSDLLDPDILHAGLIYSERGRAVLKMIYKEYIDIGYKSDIPFLSYAPTWRANPVRINKAGYGKDQNINADAIQFMKEIRSEYNGYEDNIFIGGLMGCKGDAYKPEEALSITEAIDFHFQQANELAFAQPDFIKAATFPSFTEAYGIAKVLAKTNIPYIVSFVLDKDGNLLDGTPVYKAIEEIDNQVNPKPAFYMANCIHPSVFRKMMLSGIKEYNQLINRLIGIQANTSKLSPQELNNLEYLDSSPADEFAHQIIEIHKLFGTKILGGCCGSDCSHIENIASLIE